MARPRIVLNTTGSLGDLHPYLAVALALRERGADPVIATHGMYRAKIEAERIGFHEVPPDLPDFGDPAEVMKVAMDRMRGTEYVLRTLVLPYLRAGHDALEVACRGADLLVTHPLSFAGRILAERSGQRWAATVLQPLGLMSAHDPAVFPALPWSRHLRGLGPGFHAGFHRLGRRFIRSWTRPVEDLRRELGMSPTGRHPFFEDQYSPFGTIVMFSKHLGAPQPDWPHPFRQTGFPFYDTHDGHTRLAAGLERFLDAGEPPIVFTLGSAAVMDPRGFFDESEKAAAMLGRRAVLLVGTETRERARGTVGPGIHVADYAPFSAIFPRAAVIVHQGGIGTTGQALASGRPMLVMPCAHDQPDNAYRCERLGVGLVIGRDRYRGDRVAPLLDRLQREPMFAARAEAVGREVGAEAGAAGAAEALLEAMIGR